MVRIEKLNQSSLFLSGSAWLYMAVFVEAILIGMAILWFGMHASWWLLILIAMLVGGVFGFLAWKMSRTALPSDGLDGSELIKEQLAKLPDLPETGVSFKNNKDIKAGIKKIIDYFIRSVRIIGMQAGNASAIIMELIQIHKFFGRDVNSLYDLAGKIDESNNQLAQEVSATKSQLSQIAMNMDVLATSSGDISSDIEKVANASKAAEQNLRSMAEAADNMVLHLQNVFAQLSRSSESTSEVGEATERMVCSFDDVRTQCHVANSASDEANQATRAFAAVLSELANAAKEIGAVVDFIYEIADQTNMLALNAAIEAAGAGDAGKGFAVVASEIKTLAQKTVQATSNIEEKILEIQDKSAEATSVSGQVFKLVDRIHDVNREIVQAIDGQHQATQSVSHAMEQVKDAMLTIMQSTHELESATNNVAEEAVKGVASVEEISAKASDVARTAWDMEQQTREARKFSVSTYDFAKNTNELSQQVKEKLATSLRMTRFLHGSINHFGSLADIARETNDIFHDNLLTFEGFSEPFEMFRFKSDVLSMMGQLVKAAFGNVKLKNDAFATWEKSEVGKWILANQDAPLAAMPLFEEIKSGCQGMHAAASTVIASINDNPTPGNQDTTAREAMRVVNGERRKLFAALDKLYLTPLDFQPNFTNLVEWQNNLNIGVPEIDSDHKKLFGILNVLHKSFNSEEGRNKQEAILKELIDYAKGHFAREEKYMLQANDPQLANHQAQHRGFLQQAGKSAGLVGEKSHTLLLDLSIFVRNWFLFHISKWDLEMGRHLATSGNRQKP
ncbi:MAG: bacteriohemerythrin [Magnetococcus sp. DMHC-1]|nr:bacteriohemerythrin [Magnetococcales bacterium]